MSKKQKMTAVVISQEKIAEDIYSMWLKAEPVAAEAVPGQFISMYTNDAKMIEMYYFDSVLEMIDLTVSFVGHCC